MIDPLGRSQVLPPVPASPEADALAEWDRKVALTLGRVGRLAWTYTALGLVVYGGGSVGLIFWLKDQPMLLTLIVMFFFQLCLIWFGTQAVFRCIAGGFHVGLAMNRETVPVFRRMGDKLEQAALDIRASGDRIHGEVKRLADQMERPITPPTRKLAGPPLPVGKDNGGSEAPG